MLSMKPRSVANALTLLIIPLGFMTGAFAADLRKTIGAGEFAPLYGVASELERLPVQKFELDVFPITNADFEAFISSHPEWSPNQLNKLLTDSKYLNHWCLHNQIRVPCWSDRNRPVTNVSWFAAMEYCGAKGGRLPTVLEWEYVAAASATNKDASRDPEFVQQLLTWYSRPTGEVAINEIGKQQANIWGIHDMHGLVWEWTQDFNSVFVAGDNRRDGEQLNNLFCGNGAASASDRANYAAFMRYALRNSLSGNYSMESLGFRCAYDLKQE